MNERKIIIREAIKQRVLLMPIKILWRFFNEINKLVGLTEAHRSWKNMAWGRRKMKNIHKISCGCSREWEEIKNPMSRCFCCWFFTFISPRSRTSELPQRRVIQANKKSYSFLLFSINKKSLSSLLWYLRRSICWRAHGERKRQWSKC